METTKNKFAKLRGMAPVIAQECGCSKDYVSKVFSGRRVAKSDRAKRYYKVIAVAERLLNAINPS